MTSVYVIVILYLKNNQRSDVGLLIESLKEDKFTT